MNLVITGSSSGIGRALAEHLLAHGHRVLGVARSRQDELVNQHPTHFEARQGDVGAWSEMARIAGGASLSWEHFDGLITCAGVQGEIGRTVTTDPAAWSTTVRTNLDGTYHAIRAFHTLLSKAPRRMKIICLSGGGATKARANFSAYGVAKTAIVRLVETIAEEERGTPLDINAIAPGAINTRLTDEVIARGPEVVGNAEYLAALKQKAQGGSSIEKVVSLVTWLLSPASDGITGRLLSAPWDPWNSLGTHVAELASSDIYTLRRIVPEDRGVRFG